MLSAAKHLQVDTDPSHSRFLAALRMATRGSQIGSRAIGPRRWTASGAAICGATLWAAAAIAVPPELPAAVPDDVIAACFVNANPAASDAGPLNSINVARFVVDQAGEFGLLSSIDPVSRAWIDALAALSDVIEYPHAVALFEVKARPLESGGHRLAELNGAMVIHAKGAHAAIERRIQRLLNTYTNQNESVLTATPCDRGMMNSLRDRRLDPWVVITWGPVGEYYVVAIGDGSFEKIVDTLHGRASSLQGNEWFHSAFDRMEGPKAWFALWTNFATLQNSADGSLAGKIAKVRDTLGLYDVEKGLWTVRYDDRAVNAAGYVRALDSDHLRPLTTSQVAGVSADQFIPKEAGGYAVFDVTPRQVLDLVSESYLAARSSGGRWQAIRYWKDLEVRAAISFEGQIFSNLGRGVVIHDHPRNALGLPFLWTFAAPVSGDAAQLRRALDALFAAWDDELKSRGASLRLRKDPDGVWYMFIGVNGPAVGLNDRWLVVSFSPDAVRQNLAFLADPVDRQTAHSTSSRPD